MPIIQYTDWHNLEKQIHNFPSKVVRKSNPDLIPCHGNHALCFWKHSTTETKYVEFCKKIPHSAAWFFQKSYFASSFQLSSNFGRSVDTHAINLAWTENVNLQVAQKRRFLPNSVLLSLSIGSLHWSIDFHSQITRKVQQCATKREPFIVLLSVWFL